MRESAVSRAFYIIKLLISLDKKKKNEKIRQTLPGTVVGVHRESESDFLYDNRYTNCNNSYLQVFRKWALSTIFYKTSLRISFFHDY